LGAVNYCGSFEEECAILIREITETKKRRAVMFSVYHLVWLIICAVVVALGVIAMKKRRPTLRQILNIACVGSVISEVIKTFSMLQVVPSADGSTMHLYLEMQHLPLHLCSVQILFIFYTRFARDGKVKDALLAFMYPTCIVGALLATLMPTIFSEAIDVSQAFTHPLAYQYFLFHTMLILLGIYLAMSEEVKIRGAHYFSSLAILGGCGFVSLYLNSIFAQPTYVNGELVSVEYVTNFFFTQKFPITLVFTEKWQWCVYYLVLVLLVALVFAVFYFPFYQKERATETDDKNAAVHG